MSSSETFPSRERSMNDFCGSDIDSPPWNGLFHQISGHRVKCTQMPAATIEYLNFPTERVPRPRATGQMFLNGRPGKGLLFRKHRSHRVPHTDAQGLLDL